MRSDAEKIYRAAIAASLPHAAVERALERLPHYTGRLILVAIGKAAWEMASSASHLLKDRISDGIVITKHKHARGEINRLEICEAGHPVPDTDTLRATEKALEKTRGLHADDLVLFLVSGGGSALFESIDFSLEELQNVTEELLSRGASIAEINTVRKHLSRVKGGRFAAHCAPAHVYTVVLSDVLGDKLDTIASGPTAPDSATAEDALRIASAYRLTLTPAMRAAMERETPKEIPNASYFIGGGVHGLCEAARQAAESLGYRATVLTEALTEEASTAGAWLAARALENTDTETALALITGGETVVHLRGNGLGGRNQELALSAAITLDGSVGITLFSVGSDGTDGPTDAAGGIVDGETVRNMKSAGVDARAFLENNDSYHALAAVDGLIFTGPTGTNVNDLAVALIRKNN